MESTLESEVKKPSKFSQVVDPLKQWRQPKNKAYLDHYLMNCAKIIFGYKLIDYRFISHENAVVYSWIGRIDDLTTLRVSLYNHFIGSVFLNLGTEKHE